MAATLAAAAAGAAAAAEAEPLQYEHFAPEPLCLRVPHRYLHTQRMRGLSSDQRFWDSVAAPPSSELCPARAVANDMSKDEFNARFCRPDAVHGHLQPALITGLTDTWRAAAAWQLDALHRTHGDVLFAVAGGRATLANFVRHASQSTADWPFYIFEDDFSGARSSLLDDYQPHDYFDDVLCLPDGDRPAPRYFLLGPRSSGTCMHQDPMATSAWNTLLVGKKRWCLFPPRVDVNEICPMQEAESSEDLPAAEGEIQLVLEVVPSSPRGVDWQALVASIRASSPAVSAASWGRTALIPAGFSLHRLQLEVTVLALSEDAFIANIRDRHSAEISRVTVDQRVAVAEQTTAALACPAYWFKDVWPTLAGREEELGMLDFIQQPGETIFVPHGWHHVVLNLDWTVAVSHNFISAATALPAYQQLKAEDPSSAHEWHRLLRKTRPDIAATMEPPTDAPAPHLQSQPPLRAPEPARACSDSDGERSDDEPNDPDFGSKLGGKAQRDDSGASSVLVAPPPLPPPPPPLLVTRD